MAKNEGNTSLVAFTARAFFSILRTTIAGIGCVVIAGCNHEQTDLESPIEFTLSSGTSEQIRLRLPPAYVEYGQSTKHPTSSVTLVGGVQAFEPLVIEKKELMRMNILLVPGVRAIINFHTSEQEKSVDKWIARELALAEPKIDLEAFLVSEAKRTSSEISQVVFTSNGRIVKVDCVLIGCVVKTRSLVAHLTLYLHLPRQNVSHLLKIIQKLDEVLDRAVMK